MDSLDGYLLTNYEPNAYDFKETFVESYTELLTPNPQISKQWFLEDVEAHRVHVYHSQREGLSVGQERGDLLGRPVGPIDQELNVANAQIRTLLDRLKEPILAECQAEIKKHEFQADYDRRKLLSETVESQQEELHCVQAEELRRRVQQHFHEQLLKQNSELREAHHKSLNEMEEFFRVLTVDTIARRI